VASWKAVGKKRTRRAAGASGGATNGYFVSEPFATTALLVGSALGTSRRARHIGSTTQRVKSSPRQDDFAFSCTWRRTTSGYSLQFGVFVPFTQPL
jgi:hypothetical protein